MNKFIKLSLLTILQIFFVASVSFALNAQEAKVIYDNANCSRTTLENPGCYSCCITSSVDCIEPQGSPIPDCVMPDINTFVHWDYSWDGLQPPIPDPVPDPDPDPVPDPTFYEEINGLVSIPALGYFENLNQGSLSHTWTEDGDYLRSTPDTNIRFDDNTGPVVNYKVRFVNSGVHYIWFHGRQLTGVSDSLHYGLDGVLINSMTFFNKVWSNELQPSGVAVLNADAGDYIFNVWTREDGSSFDSIRISNDPNYIP